MFCASLLQQLTGPGCSLSLLAARPFWGTPRDDASELATFARGTLRRPHSLTTRSVSETGRLLCQRNGPPFFATKANVDWLHASAESLLTLTNLINVFGLKRTLDGYVQSSDEAAVNPPENAAPTTNLNSAALASAGALLLASGAAVSPLDLGIHDPFLGGFGGLGDLWNLGFTEPANALSLPTWVIHISSLLEWLVAMGLVWRVGLASGNERWKGARAPRDRNHRRWLSQAMAVTVYGEL